MGKLNFQNKGFDLFFLIVSLIGIVVSVIRLRIAILEGDNFRTFISIVWIVLFTGSAIMNARAYRRKTMRNTD